MNDLEIAVYAIDQASRTLIATAEAIDNLGKRTEDNDRRTKKFGLTLSDLYGGFMLVKQGAQMLQDAFEQAIGPAIKLEAEFAKIEGLTNTPAAAIDGLRDSVINLSKEIPVSSQEMAEGLYFISSSGFTGAEAMDILTASSKAAAAGLGETKTIADAVTSTLNAYQMAGSDAARVTDILLTTVKEGKGEPADLAGSLGRVLPIAAAAGVSMEQVAASMATMTRTGLTAEESATALRGAIGALMAPGKQARDALESIGMSADEVRSSIRDRGLLETLQTLMEKTGGNVEILDLIIPNIRALTGVLSTAGSQAGEYSRILDSMTRASGATEKAFATMSDTVESKGKRLENTLGAIRDKLATELLPAISQAADAADTLLNGADRIQAAFDATAPKIVAQARSYDEYRNTIMATAVAAGYASQANVEAWSRQGDAALRGSYIYDLMLQRTNMLTQAQWEAASGAYGVSGGLDESARAQVRASDAAANAKITQEQKAESDRVATEAAFQNAQAADAQAKASEKARKEAADWTIANTNLAASLKEATTADLVQMSISNLGESFKAGLIGPQEYEKTLRAIQVQYDLVTPKSLAEADAMTTLNQLHNEGKITGEAYAGAIGLIDKAAADGKVDLSELGISIATEATNATTAKGKTDDLNMGFSTLKTRAGDARGAVKGVNDELAKLPAKKTVDVYVVTHEVTAGSSGGGGAPARAAGGPVSGGWPYWVGEEGPEPFIPAQGGRILSRSDAMTALSRTSEIGQLAGALRALIEAQRNNGTTLNINTGPIASTIDIEDLAFRVAREIGARQ